MPYIGIDALRLDPRNGLTMAGFRSGRKPTGSGCADRMRRGPRVARRSNPRSRVTRTLGRASLESRHRLDVVGEGKEVEGVKLGELESSAGEEGIDLALEGVEATRHGDEP